MADHEVIIVGGGPIGLTLAIALGQRGVECLLIDRRPKPLFLPKMERCHSRTMEIFRRLGIVDQVRDAGWPTDAPIDGFLVNTLQDQEALVHWPKPAVAQLAEQSSRVRDGSVPAEPYQVISQYTLEPLLKGIAERTPGVTVRFGWELESFEERDNEVMVQIRDLDGGRHTSRAVYLAGCDGATSVVRKGIGAQLAGDANVGEQFQALFYSEDLYDRLPAGMRGEHYHIADDRWSFVIVQDDRKHFTLHARVDEADEMAPLFAQIVGAEIDFETLWVGPWTMRLMLSDSYASDRVFLAGDSVHLVTPIGGLGMNTGIGDADNLAWKLAATLRGWSGSRLLESYEVERRPVGARNVAASRRAFEARKQWRDVLDRRPVLSGSHDPQEAPEFREMAYKAHFSGSMGINGIILGYRYKDSPIVVAEADDDGADLEQFDYCATARPGARLPNLWWNDGTPIQDHAGPEFTLIACAPDGLDAVGVTDIQRTFETSGAKLALLDASVIPEAAEVYERDYVLVRPDLHVAWRGNALPEESEDLVRLVTGRV